MLKKHRLLLFIAIATLSVPSNLLAKDQQNKREANRKAASLVSEALSAEASGDLYLRQRLLEEAQNLSQLPEVMWQLGYVRDHQGKWKSFDDIDESTQLSSRIAEYETLRSTTPSSVAAQMNLARWCVSKGLFDQARSHFSQVIFLDHDNVVARRALGYRNINNEWISPAQMAEFQSLGEKTLQSNKKYLRDIKLIVRNSKSKNDGVREAAQAKIMTLRESDIVPALEAYFTSNVNDAELASSGYQTSILLKPHKRSQSSRCCILRKVSGCWQRMHSSPNHCTIMYLICWL